MTIGGTDVYALNEERRSRFIRGHIGFVFQQYNLVPYLTVEENVMLPLSLAHRKADYVQVTQLLSRFGLRQRAKTTVSALSGGEQQRVALCRALLMRPAVVFARRADRRARHREQRACAAGAARAGGCGLQRGHGHA